MMKKLLFIFVILLMPYNSMANKSDVVVIVNDQPITRYELETRKKIVGIFTNANTEDTTLMKQLEKTVLDGLIEEALVKQYAKKVGMVIQDNEVNHAVQTLEERNNLAKGQLLNILSEKGGDISSFKAQIAGDLIKGNISNSLSQGIAVSPKELDNAVINSGYKDFDISAWVFKAKSLDIDTEKKMHKLQKQVKNCDKLSEKSYKDFASAQQIKQKLSKFDDITQSIISDTNIGSTSSIYVDQGDLKMILVCHKKAEGKSDDLGKVKYFVSTQKMSKKAAKFIKDLKERAYIKIF